MKQNPSLTQSRLKRQSVFPPGGVQYNNNNNNNTQNMSGVPAPKRIKSVKTSGWR